MRRQRARRLLADKEAEFSVLSNTRMRVPSQQPAHADYIVKLQQESGRRYDVRVPVSGSCKDYLHRRPPAGCKHMIAAEAFLKKYPTKRKWKL
tara:strand:+ start:315 stop:593 length:279 start_codon:yes stop_codon:yes gene_type:complete